MYSGCRVRNVHQPCWGIILKMPMFIFNSTISLPESVPSSWEIIPYISQNKTVGLNHLPPELMEFGLTPIRAQGTIPRYFQPSAFIEGQQKDFITEK